MSNDQDIKTIISLEVNQQSVSASNQALEKIKEGLEELKEPTFSEHNRQYMAEQIAYLEQYQDTLSQVILPIEQLRSTAEEAIPSIQEVTQQLEETAQNIEAIRIPREDIFGTVTDSARILAEETKKASEEAKELGANLASSITIEADPRAIEAVKTLENTTKAIDDLRKSNLISRQAWQDATSSARQLYSATEEIRREIDALNNTEIDLHDTEKVTQHRREILRLQSNYETLRQTLNSLPSELVEGLREATQENEKLAQSFAQHEQRQSRSSSSLNPITDLVTNPLVGGSLFGGNLFGGNLFGGNLFGGNLGIVNDLQEVIETLPQLGDAVKALLSALSTAVSAIGTPMGIGLIGAFGALTIGINHLTASAESGRQAMKDFFDEQEQLIRLLRTADSISILDQIASLQEERDTLLENQQFVFSNAYDISQALEERFGAFTSAIYGLSSLGLGMGFESIQGLLDGVQDSIGEVNEVDSKITGLVIALEDAEVQTRGLERAISDAEYRSVEGNQTYLDQTAKELDSLRELTGAFEENSIQARLVAASITVLEDAYYAVEQVLYDQKLEQSVLGFANLVEGRVSTIAQLEQQSAASLENRINTIESQRRSLEAGLRILEESGLVTESVTEQTQIYQDQLRELDLELGWINNGLLDSARERELAAEIEKEMIDAVLKNNREVQAVKDQYERSKVASEQKLSDDLVRIEDRRIQQIERAQEQLAEREQAINLKTSREEQDQATKLAHERQQQAVKVEREELKAEMDHARKVRDIREKSAQQETNLLLKRDFAGLFALRQRTDQEIKTAERASDEATKAREQARGEQAQDEMAKLAFEREQRQTRYQREIADAHAQAQRTQQQAQATADRELQITRDKHNQQLRDLQDAKWRELGILKKGIHDEIALIESGSVSRVRAEMQTQSALRQAQQIGMMNRVNAQPIYQLPVGYTSRNSVVNNNNGNNTFNINGNNLSAMRQVVLNILEEIWSK